MSTPTPTVVLVQGAFADASGGPPTTSSASSAWPRTCWRKASLGELQGRLPDAPLIGSLMQWTYPADGGGPAVEVTTTEVASPGDLLRKERLRPSDAPCAAGHHHMR